jgi:hypothetical protein
MAITSGSQTITTTRSQIDGNSIHSTHIHIRNNESTKTLYLGGDDVTVGNGLLVDGNTFVDFDLPPGEKIFAISSSGSHTISWLRIEIE